MDTEKPGVTVVVPTLNRGDFLYDCLTDLLAQSHRPLEILVVDQSTDVPAHIQQLIAAHPATITHYRVSFRGLPQARNYGWKHARYDAIVYVDDDVRCPPNLVREHLRALLLPNVGVVAGRIDERGRTPDATRKAGRFNYWTGSPERNFAAHDEYDVDAVAGCNFSTWRQVAASVGGVDERLNAGAALFEETEFALRVRRTGYRVYYNGSATLRHLVSPGGGCRVNQVRPYVWALAHNRTIVIQRHLHWYQRGVAHAETLRLGFAYAAHYRKPGVLVSAVCGGLAGMKHSSAISV